MFDIFSSLSKQNIVIGAWCNYGDNLITDKGGIYFFIKSLRKVNNQCKILILCRESDLCNILINFCKKMNVELLPEIPNRFIHEAEIIIYRFVFVYNYLKKNKYDKILLSDINDVIFQSDPFQINIVNELYLAAEQNILNDISNHSSKLNVMWIQPFTFLKDFHWDNFKYKYVICAGTILGNYVGIMNYLAFYNNINKEAKYNDQGLLNVYVYNYNKTIDVIDYRISKILTLDRIQFSDLKKNEKGQIINDNDELYSIIHQINRCNKNYMFSLIATL